MKGFTFTLVHERLHFEGICSEGTFQRRDTFWQPFKLPILCLSGQLFIPIFLDDQRIFLVNIDILLCVIIGLTIPSSIQCIHVCCHVRTMQAKLEAIWCEAKEKCNCMYSFAACALYSSDSIHVVLFHSVLKMTTKSHILYWVSRQVLIT